MLTQLQVTKGKELLFKMGCKTLIVWGSTITRPDSSQSYRQQSRVRQKESKLIAFQLAIICSHFQLGEPVICELNSQGPQLL